MNLEEIRKCVHSAQGTKLLLENMAATESLDPPAKIFPWVVVDGEALNSTETLLLGKVGLSSLAMWTCMLRAVWTWILYRVCLYVNV